MSVYNPVSNNENDISKFVCDKYEKLKLNKSTWENHWKEIADYFQPNKNDIWGANTTKGDKKGNELFDATGARYAERFASFLYGMMINPAVAWITFSTGDEEIDNDPDAAKWIQDTSKKVLFTMNNSNFPVEAWEVFMDLATFHTSHMRLEEDTEEVIRCTSRPIYEVAISENYKGEVDCSHYEYKVTAEQLCQEFEDVVPEEIKNLRFKEPLKEYTILHAIEPSGNFPDKIKHPLLPYTSVRILKETYTKLEVKGFEENPVIITRLQKLSGEMYGRGPAMRALPDIKTANAMMRTWVEGAQLAIQPPIQAPDEGVLLPVKLTPGGTNYYRADSKDRIEPIITGGNPNIGYQIIELLHKNIREAFYLDQMQLVENDRMTATEVMQRKDENFRSLASFTARIHNEFLVPAVLRTMKIMQRKGLIDKLPDILKDRKLEIKFISQLARSQQTVDMDALLRAYQVTEAIAKTDATVMDAIDLGSLVRTTFKGYNAPLHVLRSSEEEKQIKVQRAEQNAQANNAELAKTESEAAKNMAQAGTMGV